MKKPPKKILPLIVLAVIGGVIVKTKFFNGDFRYAGTLEATRVDLSARLSSSIDKVKVQEGDRIKEGDTLVTFTCEDIEIAARLAHENFVRYSKLFKGGSATPETLDQMRNRKEDADTHLQWCKIVAPIQGKVLNRYHEPGEWTAPGTKILTVANVRDIWAYIYVPQPLIAKLSPGMKLRGVLPEMNQRVFEGVILKINDEAEFTPKNVQTRLERERLVFGVKVGFNASNAEEILKPGMTIEMEIP